MFMGFDINRAAMEDEAVGHALIMLQTLDRDRIKAQYTDFKFVCSDKTFNETINCSAELEGIPTAHIEILLDYLYRGV
ncbi:hypothetical protein MMC26_003389 [Xylographa opegraphella]|nr:hypothetical protein [Xylographa opegraphella]